MEKWKVDLRGGCVAVYESNKNYNCLDIDRSNFIYFAMGEIKEDGWTVAEEDIKKANLIASAPELLGALKNMLQSQDCEWENNDLGNDWKEACDIARKAIVKAQGK